MSGSFILSGLVAAMVVWAIALYNRLVRRKNMVESFPGNIIADRFKFIEAKFFELEDPVERAVPGVSFD